jgi:fatty acid kinase fatty acid binding subunit
MTVAVLTDSAANLPASEISKYGITVQPMYLKFGERVYRDGVDITPEDFYGRLADERVPVSTAGISIGDFRELYSSALQRADAAVCIIVASFVSVTYQSAVTAADEFGGRIRVLDSKTASMAEGFVALEAARLAQTGADLEAVLARAEDMVRRVQLVATINTFEYLRRSGRVHALLAYAGTALNIKPVFAFRGGQIEQLGRPRSRTRALERLVEEVRRASVAGPLHLGVAHADCHEEAGPLLERLRQEVDCVETFLTEFTPLMGAHTGPGVLAVCYWA